MLIRIGNEVLNLAMMIDCFYNESCRTLRLTFPKWATDLHDHPSSVRLFHGDDAEWIWKEILREIAHEQLQVQLTKASSSGFERANEREKAS